MASEVDFALDTNIADLHASLIRKIARFMDENDRWRLFSSNLPPRYAFSAMELRDASKKSSASYWILMSLGQRGMSVVDLIKYLDKVAFVEPQLVLRRKFLCTECRHSSTLARIKPLGIAADLSTVDLDENNSDKSVKNAGSGDAQNDASAVFYFVGHGLEASGQCFLLPVDAPVNYNHDDCLSVNWLLFTMQRRAPSLNVVLLDISSGGGAYEVRGETHGVFMKYLKKYLTLHKPVVDILQNVLRELEFDTRAAHVQFPEINTTLSRPLSLADPIAFVGHTQSFDLRTMHWQNLYELPEPICVDLPENNCTATIGFHYCGHFCNLLLAHTSVSFSVGQAELGVDADHGQGEHVGQDDCASLECPYVAYLDVQKPAEGQLTMCTDAENRPYSRTLIKHLQKPMDQLIFQVCLVKFTDFESDFVGDKVKGLEMVEMRHVRVPPTMIMRL